MSSAKMSRKDPEEIKDEENYDSDNDFSKKAETVLNSEADLNNKSVNTVKSEKSKKSLQSNNYKLSNFTATNKIKSKQNFQPSTYNKFFSTENKVNENKPNFNDTCENILTSIKLQKPIINKATFINSLSKDIDDTFKLKLKLFDYDTLKEIIENCGSYPNNFRNYIWKFLLSLPNNKSLFDIYSLKGIHPFYANLDLIFPVQDNKLFRKLQLMCSALTYWSPHVGNVYFLPNLVFPFVKTIKGDDLFLFELIIAFINSYCQYWFEFYPGAPLNHLKLCEKIIERENPKVFNHLKNLEKENNLISLKLPEIIWRMFKNNFSEGLIKENWLQYMDFILTYNHKPEILFYFSCAYLLKKDGLILKCTTKEEIENILFNSSYEKNSNLNLYAIFKLSLTLQEKYSKYQLYPYLPHQPFNINNYPTIDKFPLDFVETTAKLREDLFKENNNLKTKQKDINELEEKFKQLAKKEEMMQRAYECLVDREKAKGEIIKKELDLILYQKTKFYDEMKNRKLDKVDRINSLIDKSLKFYDNMNTNELAHFEDEMRKRKVLEGMDLKHRLQEEELNNIEFEANRKMINLLNIRTKDEENRKLSSLENLRTKERQYNTRILEEKWKTEDEEIMKGMDNLRNLKEYELVKRREENNFLDKEYTQKLNEYEHNIYIAQVERERRARQLESQFEYNKMLIENQEEKRNNFLNNEGTQNEEMKQKRREQNTILINKMKDNLNFLIEEERDLVNYEQNLKKRELDNRLEELKKRNENENEIDNKFFEDQCKLLEEEKKKHFIKKEEIEKKKRELITSINNIAGSMNGSYPQSNRFTQSELSEYREDSLQYNNSIQKEREKGNLKYLNQGIRSLAGQTNSQENSNYNYSVKGPNPDLIYSNSNYNPNYDSNLASSNKYSGYNSGNEVNAQYYNSNYDENDKNNIKSLGGSLSLSADSK